MLGLPADGHIIVPRMSWSQGLSLLSSKFMSDVDTLLYILKNIISSHYNMQVQLCSLCCIGEEAKTQTNYSFTVNHTTK